MSQSVVKIDYVSPTPMSSMLLLLSRFLEEHGPSFSQGCFVLCLVDICYVALEKKNVKSCFQKDIQHTPGVQKLLAFSSGMLKLSYFSMNRGN